MLGVGRALRTHLGSRQVARVIYGTIIGLALVVALGEHPPATAVVAGSLLVTAFAVALAEVYSKVVGIQTRTGRRVRREEFGEIAHDAVSVAFGVGFPAVFFLLAVIDAMDSDTAFTVQRVGAALIGFYGFWAARLAGGGVAGRGAASARSERRRRGADSAKGARALTTRGAGRPPVTTPTERGSSSGRGSDRGRGVDQREVTERLREVADRALPGDVVLLRE
jgi:hypothetical protein